MKKQEEVGIGWRNMMNEGMVNKVCKVNKGYKGAAGIYFIPFITLITLRYKRSYQPHFNICTMG